MNGSAPARLRGGKPGKRPRGPCPDCGQDVALTAWGDVHARHLTSRAHRLAIGKGPLTKLLTRRSPEGEPPIAPVVLRALAEVGTATAQQIANRVDRPLRRVHGILYSLERQGRAHRASARFVTGVPGPPRPVWALGSRLPAP